MRPFSPVSVDRYESNLNTGSHGNYHRHMSASGASTPGLAVKRSAFVPHEDNRSPHAGAVSIAGRIYVFLYHSTG
jgi:hypothetical protein